MSFGEFACLICASRFLSSLFLSFLFHFCFIFSYNFRCHIIRQFFVLPSIDRPSSSRLSLTSDSNTLHQQPPHFKSRVKLVLRGWLRPKVNGVGSDLCRISWYAHPEPILRERWLVLLDLCLRQEVVGLWIGSTGGKDRAQFPGRILGGFAKPISLTMESSDTIGRPPSSMLVSLFVAMGISTLISLQERGRKLITDTMFKIT